MNVIPRAPDCVTQTGFVRTKKDRTDVSVEKDTEAMAKVRVLKVAYPGYGQISNIRKSTQQFIVFSKNTIFKKLNFF